MVAYQLSIFAENKPGKLARVTGVLAKEKINIRATTIATADTFGVINLIVDDPRRAEKALSDAGMTCLLYTSPSPRDRTRSRMPSSA